MEKSLMVGDYLFVSKMSYGAKVPNTVLAIPFIHNTMPLTETVNSYLDWISLPYYRFFGCNKVQRYDAVVFNYPTGDTVILERKAEDYYRTIRREGRNKIWKNYTIISRPVDKEENYVKRCVGIAGDTLLYDNQALYINGKKMEDPKGLQFLYHVQTQSGTLLSKKRFTQLGVSLEDIENYQRSGYIPLTNDESEQIKKMSDVSIFERMRVPKEVAEPDIFPFDTALFRWNLDNFGPLYIPEAGVTIPLTKENIALYRRIIEVYEHNTFETDGEQIKINGQYADTYTFKMNYYWMMGDNRHNSLDARYWGFVPENHIVGKASFVLLSLNKDKSLFHGKIRFNRILKRAK
jgi:signal peptidase I